MTLYTKALDNCVVLATGTSAPGTGYATVASVQAAFNQARSANLPLFIRPGVYQTTEITVTSANGGGNLLAVSAVPGTVALQLTSGANLLTINGIYSCRIENLILDGNNVAFTGGATSAALISITSAQNLEIVNCQMQNSTACGLYATSNATAAISDCAITACSYGIWGLDAILDVKGNKVQNCTNNGVMIHTSTVTGNSSSVAGNLVTNIGSQSGTGQNGNGINVFRAVAVNVANNRISGCQYSAIRVNGGGDALVTGNNCYGSREFAIFLEAPAQGINLNGGIVAGNVVDTAGGGISVANSGGSGQGTARSVSITGNRVTGVVKRTINDPGYIPTVSIGFGISVETGCVISGNIVDGAQGIGITAGHNAASGDVNISGNLVLNAPLGIGYSAQAGQLAITGNQVSGATSGGIVAVQYDDSTDTLSKVSGTPDYGNTADSQHGVVYVGNNRSY